MRRFFPFLEWLPNYKRSYLSKDLSAGLTVGVIMVPQGMAYAMIAGLPPVFGLYAALVPQVVYALLGTSRQLAVGPVAMDSLLVASGLGALALSGMDKYITMAIFLALFMGSIQLLLGVLKMGFLVNFLSKPVISGFTSAAAIIIGLSQLRYLLGTEITRSNKIHLLLQNAAETIDETNFYALGIGVLAMILLKGLGKIDRRIPAAIVVVALGILAVYLFHLNDLGVGIVGAVPEGLPSFNIPVEGFSRISQLFPIALTLALVAFMEAISVAKAVEEKHDDYEVNSNKELVALGTSNIVGALFQSYPTTGGFSRTAVNDQAGAKTAMASIISAAVVGLTLLFLTPLFYYLPHAVLAAIIMVAVFGLIDLKYPLRLYKNQKDEFVLLLATFFITLLVGIKEGILFGVLLSLLLLLYRTSRPHIAVLGRIKGTNYFRNVNRFADDVEEDGDILILRFDSQLYFGNTDYFKKSLYKQIDKKRANLRWIILDAEAISYIDSSAVLLLEHILADLKKRGIRLMIADAKGPTRDILYRSGLLTQIGEDNIFMDTQEAYHHLKNKEKRFEKHKKMSIQSNKECL